MPQTRGNAKTGADAQRTLNTQDKENVTPRSPQTEQSAEHQDKTRTARRKRKSSPSKEGEPKKRKSTPNTKPSATDDGGDQRSQKPRLTTPDLEFDYDRSQLRDPRPTPGRKARPRYEEFDIPVELKDNLLSTREIPKPEKPKGRLNWLQKDQLFKEEGRLNALHAFHHLYRCHGKGREGSPSYDHAGFESDLIKWETG